MPTGTVLLLFFRGHFMTTDAYRKRRETEEGVLAHSAIQYVGDLVLYNVETHYEDYINHSDNPNVLYHCGIGFALHDIHPNEELTVDYRLWLPTAEDSFADKDTHQLVTAGSARAALQESTRQLQQLLRRCLDAPSLPPIRE